MIDSTHIPTSGCERLASPTKPQLDDVLVQAQAGDPDAFTKLYLRHKKRVFSICLRMVHDSCLAEDLTQETFIQLHRKVATFRGDSLFTTWLHRMTVNIVLMRLRKRALPVVSLDHLITDRSGVDFKFSLGANDSRQVGVVDRLAINRAVATLPPGYRNIFLLHDVNGFEHREIASMEGCSLGNSKSQLHKARRALRGTLSAHADRVCRTKGGTTPVTGNGDFQRRRSLVLSTP
jgi:RNA polymerase sigma-70 factor (ECF subfamily)